MLGDISLIWEIPVEAGKLTSVIDRTYPLGEARLAIGHVGEGHTRGKIVITV